MGKRKYSEVKGFSNISREKKQQKKHAISKAWDEWIPIAQEKYGEKQTFQNYEVPKYFLWSRNPYNSQTTGWVNSHIMELAWENADNSQVLLYLTDLELMGTHAILILCECPIPITYIEIFFEKPYHSQVI